MGDGIIGFCECAYVDTINIVFKYRHKKKYIYRHMW